MAMAAFIFDALSAPDESGAVKEKAVALNIQRMLCKLDDTKKNDMSEAFRPFHTISSKIGFSTFCLRG